MGQKNLAALTGDCFNEGSFYKKMYGCFAGRAKKVALMLNEVVKRQGSTTTASLLSRL